MITKGSKVKVTDSYSGNLKNVIGKIGTVLDVERESPGLMRYLLDIEGDYRVEGPYYSNGYYDSTSQVIANANEIEEFSYGMKDFAGQVIEIGDTVVYSSNEPGIIKGVVTDFREFSKGNGWSSEDTVVRVQVEVERPVNHYDGFRRFATPGCYFQWYEHGTRMLVIKKNLNRLILDGMNDLKILDC
jgi:hypothetical protein